MNVCISDTGVSALELKGIDPFSPTNEDILRFPFSIDAKLDQRFEELQKFGVENPYQPEDSALLIGNGSLLSLAPVLPGTIFVTDYSTSLLAWMNSQLTQLETSQSRSEFIDWLHDTVPANRRNLLRVEKSDDQQHHFLKNDETFENARSALLDVDVHFVKVDYKSTTSVKSLGRTIMYSGNLVRVANFTNVHARAFMSLGVEHHEHIQGVELFAQRLSSIPFTNPAFIFGSSTKSGLEPMPVAPDLQTYRETMLDDISVSE